MGVRDLAQAKPTEVVVGKGIRSGVYRDGSDAGSALVNGIHGG